MGMGRVLCLLSVVLAGGAVAAPTACAKGHSFDAAEFPGYEASFRLKGSNGYSIEIGAYAIPQEEKEHIFISAARRGSYASYAAPVRMTATTISADLGSLGKVDLHLNPSGRKRTIPIKCSRGDTFTYEPGIYEGILEFNGEEGYTRVSETQIPLRPQLTSFCGGSSGYGEGIGADEPGARLRGISFAHGRSLSFQISKNSPHAKTLFTASLKERHDRMRIYRGVGGFAPASAFHWVPDLSTATLSPPAPFAGSSTLVRRHNSVSPRWGGNLTLDFPGRSNIHLAGPSVHASLVHARYTRSNGSSVAISLRRGASAALSACGHWRLPNWMTPPGHAWQAHWHRVRDR